jgi:hypothetical protein
MLELNSYVPKRANGKEPTITQPGPDLALYEMPASEKATRFLHLFAAVPRDG